MTRPRLRSLCVLGPFFIFMACSSGGSAGPGGGGAGGSAGHGGTGSGSAGKGGASGSGGTSGVAGTSGGGGSGAAGSGGTGGSAAGSGGAAGAGGSAGGAAGAGGSAGAAGGAAGSGGAAGAAGGAAGSGGAAGAAGSGGGGGTGAAAGASGGAGGAAGAGGSGGAGGATTTNLRVEYLNSSAAATTFSVRITNLGPSTPLISGLRIRYYFHDDTTNPDGGPGRDATPTVTAATWQIASPSTSINLRSTGGCGASAAFTTPATIDLGCYLASPMNVQDTVTIAISVDPTTQLAANDYSYADTAGAFAANDHLTLFWNGVLQSGTPPP